MDSFSCGEGEQGQIFGMYLMTYCGAVQVALQKDLKGLLSLPYEGKIHPLTRQSRLYWIKKKKKEKAFATPSTAWFTARTMAMLSKMMTI